MKIILFGIGKYIDAVEDLLQEEVEILCYVDNDMEKQMVRRKDKEVRLLQECSGMHFDYIVITAFYYQSIEKQLLENGYSGEQIIPFFQENFPFEDYNAVFKPIQSFRYSMECRLKLYMAQMERRQKLFYENFIYEMADRARKEKIELPRICSVEETCQKIIDEKVSVSRYGDGEFQIILGAAKDVYQDDDRELSRRLQEILISNLDGHIVALADDYGCMEGLREENKNVIRGYMTSKKRREHYQYIDMEKQYYNAYISRPYIIYPHEEREMAKNRFLQLKKIWDGRKVLIVEGEHTRTGVGNDLLDNVKSIERIIAPGKNAFSAYGEIREAVLGQKSDRLVLAALGPAATVLAYDLAGEGYQTIDIGHLDLEYEWYLKGEGYSQIHNKYNNEVPGGTIVEDIYDEDYDRSVIKRIVLETDG